MYAIGYDKQPTGNINADVTSAAHNALARDLAERSITLLQNTGGLLPLNKSAVRRIAVFGDETTVAGDGSGHVIAPYVITPAMGIYNYVNPNSTRPVNCTFFPDTDFNQVRRCAGVHDGE